MPLATINAVWVGPTLGRIHAACLRSFVRHGHRTVLHAYERPDDLPVGVELADASLLMPASRVVRHRETGSFALSSDLLRYELLRQGQGLYVDCDVFCLKPIEDAEFIFGWETRKYVNTAVLKATPALFEPLCRIKDARGFIPPWMTSATRRAYRWRALIGRPVGIEDMPWGSVGPKAVTWHLREAGLLHHARPFDVFYPLTFDRTKLLLDPDLSIEDLITHRTILLHLFNNELHKQASGDIPSSSPLGRMLAM